MPGSPSASLSQAETRLLASVDSLQDELRTFLATLVQTESVNPPGSTRRIASVTAEMLRAFAPEVREVGPEPEIPSLLATVNPGPGPVLLFNSHMDTVPVGDRGQWRYDPFSGEIVDGVLYGRGSADAKGCLAAMIMAGKALALCGVQLGGALILNPVSDEEVGGQKGAQWIVDQQLVSPDAVVIGEITRNRVAIAHKGVIWFRLVTHGRTAHASTPWEGVSAISHMVTLLHRLQTELGQTLAQRSHPITPPPSLNLGMIRGGVKVNVVADRCEVELDRRILPTETVDGAVTELRAIVEGVRQELPGLNVDVEVLLTGEPLDTGADEGIVQTALAASQALGLPAAPVGYQQASDGRFFSARGIPTILIGPGVPEVAHTPDEHVALEEVYQAARLYALVAYRWLNRSTP